MFKGVFENKKNTEIFFMVIDFCLFVFVLCGGIEKDKLKDEFLCYVTSDLFFK